MTVRVLVGDAYALLATLPAGSARCCVTSPPYWGLRDYGHPGQIGLEATPEEYLTVMVAVLRDVRRVLTDDGTLWLNMGDTYASGGTRSGNSDGYVRGSQGTRICYRPTPMGLKPKDLVGIPWSLALALRADSWYLRCDIVWAKPNPMPESVTDRPTKAHEYVFLLSKSERYFYDGDAIREGLESAGGWKTPDGWDTSAGDGAHGSFHKQGREKGKPREWSHEKNPIPPAGGPRSRAGVSADDYDTRKWQDRSDGLSRPPMTMRDRQYHPLGRNARSVWTIPTAPFSEAHFATFPPELARRCILAGSAVGDTVLDPFGGAGTTGLVADRLNRHAVLLELNPDYAAMAERRISSDAPLFDPIAPAPREPAPDPEQLSL
jgi:DNA modification methylase